MEPESEEDFFYESLDRVLSSSSSSTSASEDESNLLKSFDLWLSEPASVQDRRRLLLHQMGLSGDLSLSRLKPDVQEVPRSVSCNGIYSRSRSDGSVDGLDGEDDAQRCTIKDLDNGKEFVLDDLRQNGVSGNVREVGTGKQLTIEEFEICVGSSPIVRELMRRERVEEEIGFEENGGLGSKKRVRSRSGWFRSLRNVVSAKDRRSSDERDTSSEKGGRRSSSATDDSQDLPERERERVRVRVRQYGKGLKELSGLCLSQEIQAHSGAVWTVRMSLDGGYLASAGEDCVIRVWQVLGDERKVDLVGDGMKCLREGSLKVPEQVFALSERPVCSFVGHLDDVLDLSWSKSQVLEEK